MKYISHKSSILNEKIKSLQFNNIKNHNINFRRLDSIKVLEKVVYGNKKGIVRDLLLDIVLNRHFFVGVE